MQRIKTAIKIAALIKELVSIVLPKKPTNELKKLTEYKLQQKRIKQRGDHD